MTLFSQYSLFDSSAWDIFPVLHSLWISFAEAFLKFCTHAQKTFT